MMCFVDASSGAANSFRWTVVFAFLATTLDAAGRPCAENDWRFTFGECSHSGHRNVYTFAAGKGDIAGAEPVCDAQHAESVPKLLPLLNVSCKYRCPSGTHLGIALETSSDKDIAMVPRCKVCPAGKFSLGGGVLVSGVAGDWRRRWPTELQTTCMYKDIDNLWYLADERAQTCSIHVEAPSSVSGSYNVAAADWNAEISSSMPRVILGTLVLAPGDGLACGPLTLPKQSDTTRHRVLLVRPGGCLPKEKAFNAAKAGAQVVLLYSSRYEAFPTVPSGERVSGHLRSPEIPLFAVTREDGEILQAAMTQSVVILNITSFTCQAAGRNESKEDRGCNTWQADPSGRFIHSGNNSGFHQLVSTLSLQVRLVRPGHVIFRYNVDAEKTFDGMSFEVDWNQVLPLVSKQATYTDVHVNLTAGAHSLRWMYQKDYSHSTGRDSARIQLIEVAGTSHADLECRGCHSARTHSGVGAAHCNICGNDEYLEVDASAAGNYAACSACPAGRWSPPGSLGRSSCQTRKPCGPADVETSFTLCVAEKRYVKRWFRQPIKCDPDLPGTSVNLGTAQEVVPCEPCQPNEHRPDGGRCVPKFVTCPAQTYAVRELKINKWLSWPRNFSRDVWTLSDESDEDPSADHVDDDHPTGHSWRLDEKGEWAWAGTHGDSIIGSTNPLHGALDGWFGDAMLHLDVALFATGHVSFVADVNPSRAWGQEARFLVDGAAAEEIHVEWLTASRIQAFVPLAVGKHQLTWVWQHRETYGVVQAGSSQVPPAAASPPRRLGQTHDIAAPTAGPVKDDLKSIGIRLMNVTVVHADGAGASRCAPCLQGHEVSQDSLRCDPCERGTFRAIPGKASLTGSNTDAHCQPCPAGTYSSERGSTSCRICGEGLTSAAGAAACTPKGILSTDDGGEGLTSWLSSLKSFENVPEPSVFNVTAISQAWDAVTGASPGPFEIAGRHYVLGLFSPTVVPGDDEGGRAYAWERYPQEAHGTENSGSGGNAECISRIRETDYDSLGSTMTYIRAVSMGSLRGIRVGYGEGDPCGSGLASRGATIFFKCSLDAVDPMPAFKDDQGLSHMPRLRLAVTSSLTKCSNISLEWPTRAACPLCRDADFKPEKAECGLDGYREVNFIQQTPCTAGERPKSYRQRCQDGNDAQMQEKQDNVKWILMLVIISATALGCLLCGYACYLHRKYSKYIDV